MRPRILLTHYKEGYVAWMMARECEEHKPAGGDNPGEDDSKKTPGIDQKTADGSNTGHAAGDKNHANTGDDMLLLPLLLLALFMAAAIAGLLLWRRNNSR